MAQSLYCSVQQFKDLAVTQATIDRWTPGSVLAMLQEASSFADTFIKSQLTLPLPADGYDMWLSGLVADIAAYKLYVKFGFNGNMANADKAISSRYLAAVDWLGQYSRQEVEANWVGLGEQTELAAAGPYVYSTPSVGFGTGNDGNGGGCCGF